MPKRKIPKKGQTSGQKTVKRALFDSETQLETVQESTLPVLENPTTECVAVDTVVPSTSAGTVRLEYFCLGGIPKISCCCHDQICLLTKKLNLAATAEVLK